MTGRNPHSVVRLPLRRSLTRVVAVRSRAAFTLVELISAMASSTILLAGLAAAVRIALQANMVPDLVRKTLDASDVIADIADEVCYAIYVAERSDKVLQIAVPDMDEDGIDDVIRYEWSGTPGDPLTRTFNFGTPLNIAEDVQDFSLSYLLRTQDEELSLPVESEVQKLTHVSGGDFPKTKDIKSTYWIGQTFLPNLDAAALHWKITSIELYNQDNGAIDGDTRVQIRPATGPGTPTSEVLEEVQVLESSLGVAAWRSYPFSTMNKLPIDTRYCIVVEHIAGDKSAKYTYQDPKSKNDHGLLASTNQGASFTYTTTKQLQYKVWGTETILEPGSVQHKYLNGIGAALQTGVQSQSSMRTGIPLVNTPASLSRRWKLDFDIDPTLTDADFDDAADWEVRGGGNFDTNRLSLGIWDADSSVLDTTPDCDFDTLTTVMLRMRNTSIGGEGAVFEVSADHSGGSRIPLKVSLALQGDSTQTLTVWKKTDATTWEMLDQATGLWANSIDVRMVIDPAVDGFGVLYNGVQLGGYDYTPFSGGTVDKFASIYEDGSDAEFDYVSISVQEP